MDELTNYIIKSEKEGDRVILDLADKKEQLQSYEFLVGVHLFIKELTKIKESLFISDAKISINFYECMGGEYMLGSYVYSLKSLSESDNSKLKELDNQIYSTISAICQISKYKYGTIQHNGIDMKIKEIEPETLIEAILCDDFKTMYRNTVLELELNRKENSKTSKLKV